MHYSMSFRSKGKHQNSESSFISFFLKKIFSKITKNAENGIRGVFWSLSFWICNEYT